MAFFHVRRLRDERELERRLERGMLPGVGCFIPGLCSRTHRWWVHQYATEWDFDFFISF